MISKLFYLITNAHHKCKIWDHLTIHIMQKQGGRVGLVVRALAFHQCGPGSISELCVIMWVEFVGALLCHERFFPGSSGFPLSSKTNILFHLNLFDL